VKLYLHQFLSRTGLFRSKSCLIKAVRNGEVTVGGEVIVNPMHNFDPNKKKVFWKGKLLKPVKKKICIAINKPEGFLSSRLSDNDQRMGKRSIFELVERTMDSTAFQSLFCVGRLDEDSSGLLLLTNDGSLSHRLASPDSKVGKTYDVWLRQPVSKGEIAQLERGVVIELEENGDVTHYRTKGCRVEAVSADKKHVTLTLTEGKKREVRRMFEALGNKVAQLQRSAIGNLKLKDLGLGKGEHSILTAEQVEKLG